MVGLHPLDVEYKIKTKKEIISETDMRGVIRYVNDGFLEISGYKEEELIGAPHSKIRHIDVPKTVFKLLWDSLSAGKDYRAIVQNKRKGGKYYWVYSEYEVLFDKDKKARGYRSKRYAVPKSALKEITALYDKLLEIEKTKSQKDAEMFLELKLHNEGFADYNEFIEDLYNKKLKSFSGFFGKLFGR